jgi:hypothetical protein
VQCVGRALREQRRPLWWNSVKRLSKIDAESRGCFLHAAHDYFGIERTLDYYLANSLETQHHFCLMTRPELQQLAAAGMTIGAHCLSHPVLSQMSKGTGLDRNYAEPRATRGGAGQADLGVCLPLR